MAITEHQTWPDNLHPWEDDEARSAVHRANEWLRSRLVHQLSRRERLARAVEMGAAPFLWAASMIRGEDYP